MNKEIKRILTVSSVLSIVSAGFGVFSYYLTKKLVSVALLREAPKFTLSPKRQISGSNKESIYPEDFYEKSESFKNGSFEVVKIKAYDGIDLIGHLKRAENPKRIIIAMHGWRSAWYKDFCMIAPFWNREGSIVLYAEQRGHSKSGGDYLGFGMIERHDAVSWSDWAKKFFPDLPIYLAGTSMGASTVLMASGLKLNENVSGIIADSGYTSPYEIWMHVVKNNLRISYAIIGSMANDICKKMLNVSAKECTTLDALSKTKIPVLFIHGTDDTFVPIEMTYENYKACKAKKRLLIVPEAGHITSYIKEKGKYEQANIDFWNEFDKKKAEL